MTQPAQSNSAHARKLAEEVVARADCTLKEAILADAIAHLADAIGDLADELQAQGRSLRDIYDRLGP